MNYLLTFWSSNVAMANPPFLRIRMDFPKTTVIPIGLSIATFEYWREIQWPLTVSKHLMRKFFPPPSAVLVENADDNSPDFPMGSCDPTTDESTCQNLGVSRNGRSPIAGWFIMENSQKRRMFSGYPHFRKPPNR